MPVDQAGEDILFVRDGTDIEVHVRIRYEGEAENFAWLVPIQAIPEVRVGSEPWFTELSNATAPRWSLRRTFIQAATEEEDDGDDDDGGGGVGFIPAPEDEPAEPQVVIQETVGEFEVVVLEGEDAGAVLDWLEANDYAQDEEALPIVQDYLDEGFLFAAVKLSAGASVDAIHPLVFRFQGDEPCIPIRLTRIAATPNMAIRAYFLGAARWAPSNYAHVLPNPLRFDWSSPTLSEYVALLSAAVDEAGGRAWATEYAGPSGTLNKDRFYRDSWTSAGFAEMTALEALDAINERNFTVGSAFPNQLLVLMREYLPAYDDKGGGRHWGPGLGEPMTLTEEMRWWAAAYVLNPGFIDDAAWDGPAFAAALDASLIEPAMHAADLIETWPTLTRLHTTLDPAEMTLDPTFHPVEDLPQTTTSRATLQTIYADWDWATFDVPLEPGAPGPLHAARVCGDRVSYPRAPMARMPAALRIEQIPAVGPVQVIADNQAEILAKLEAVNTDKNCATLLLAEPESDSGCACRLDAGPSPGGRGPRGAGGLAALAALALIRRRR